MPATATAAFTQNLKSSQAVATAAKSTYNDAANAVLIYTAGANGDVVYGVKAIPRATVATAIQAQLYRSPDAGTTMNFIDAAVIPAYSMSATTAPTKTDFGYSESVPIRLGPNERLYGALASALAGGVVFDAQGESA